MTYETSGAATEFGALQAVITALQPFDHEDRERIFRSAATFLQIDIAASRLSTEPRTSASIALQDADELSSHSSFSTAGTLSPKEFLYEKQPRSDVERIAVLAYYLTHHRETPHFKTLDLSKLNTEAAQPKFSNAASSSSNAVKQGYLVPSTKGQRQISANGERFVNALPDREAAQAAMIVAKPRRKPRRQSTTKKASSVLDSRGE